MDRQCSVAVLALQCLPGGRECAATLLGAAHSIRGCLDESSLVEVQELVALGRRLGGAVARNRLVCALDMTVTDPEWALGYRWDVVLRGRDATPMEA